MRVRDGRAIPSVCLAKADLSILAERVEKRRLAPTRSTYLALMEAAGEPGGWTRKKLAERAGLGGDGLRQALLALESLGFLRSLDDGSLELASPSGSAEVSLPVSDPAASPLPRPPENGRAAAFFRWHSAQVEAYGKRPSRTPQALAAAERILGYEPDSQKIKERLTWALSHRFYADKVLLLTGFEKWWARISAAYLADAGGGTKPEPAAASFSQVSYGSDRVEVAR